MTSKNLFIRSARDTKYLDDIVSPPDEVLSRSDDFFILSPPDDLLSPPDEILSPLDDLRSHPGEKIFFRCPFDGSIIFHCIAKLQLFLNNEKQSLKN